LKQEKQIQWSIKFVILVAIAFVITMQVVYAQGQLNNTRVVKPYSYRNELINRIINSTCTEKRLVIGAEKPTSVLYLSTIEKIFKNCVAEGAIK
jgi:predicted phosphatase